MSLWKITPRDPIVLGDGRGGLPYVVRQTWPLPIPATMAGMARAAHVADRGEVSRDLALKLLRHIRVRGPWVLWEQHGRLEHCFFPPADVMRHPKGRLVQARVFPLKPDEGVSWPRSLPSFPPPPEWVELPESDRDGQKLEPLCCTVWPLPELLRFALDLALESTEEGGPHLALEPRIHVALNAQSQTADPGQLFSSTGVRFEESCALGLEVEVDREASLGSPARQVVLGGESRPSFLELFDGGLPEMGSVYIDEKPLGEWLERAARGDGQSGTNSMGAAQGIRLQLLTHACLPTPTEESGSQPSNNTPYSVSGWLPSWLVARSERFSGCPRTRKQSEALQDVTLTLTALCMPNGYIPISGWNLQATSGESSSRTGAPREVRRLVPAGSIYYFTATRNGQPLTGTGLISIFEALWMSDLEPAGGFEPDERQMRAHPAHDGFGLVLPGLWRRGR